MKFSKIILAIAALFAVSTASIVVADPSSATKEFARDWRNDNLQQLLDALFIQEDGRLMFVDKGQPSRDIIIALMNKLRQEYNVATIIDMKDTIVECLPGVSDEDNEYDLFQFIDSVVRQNWDLQPKQPTALPRSPSLPMQAASIAPLQFPIINSPIKERLEEYGTYLAKLVVLNRDAIINSIGGQIDQAGNRSFEPKEPQAQNLIGALLTNIYEQYPNQKNDPAGWVLRKLASLLSGNGINIKSISSTTNYLKSVATRMGII